MAGRAAYPGKPFHGPASHPRPAASGGTTVTGPLPVQFSNAMEMLSMSPDATRLALAQLSLEKSNPAVAVTIITLSTGASHTWSLRTFLEPQSMSGTWSANSQRFETTWQNSPSLDEFTDSVSVTAPGTRLPAAHAIAVPSGIRRHLLDQTAAPNGDVFFVNSSYLAPKWNLVEYSAADQQFSRVLGPVRRTTNVPTIEWVSNDAQVLIVTGMNNGLGVLSHGRYIPLLQTPLLRNLFTEVVW